MAGTLANQRPAAAIATPAASTTPNSAATWDNFLTQMDQYFGPLSPANSLAPGSGSKTAGFANSPIVNVPGIGPLQRYYQATPTQDQYTVSNGADAGFGSTSPDVAGYQAALDAYNKLTPDEHYSFGNNATIAPDALKGHLQTYGYDPTTGGVKADGTAFDNTPNFFEDKLWPAIVLSGIAAAGGAAFAGAGAAGVGAGEAGGIAGAEAGAGGFDATALAAGEDAIGSGAYYGAGAGALDAGGGGELASDAATGFGGDGAVAGSGAATVLDPVSVVGSASGGGIGGLTAEQVAALGVGGLGGAGAALSGGSSAVDPTSSFVQPTNATQATTDIANSAPNVSSTSSSSTNPFSAISDFYNNGFGASPSSYLSLASLLGSGASALLGSNASKNAAAAQVNAANNSTDLAKGIYNSNTALNAPFVSAGTGAVNQLANLNGVGPTGAAGQATAQQNFLTSDPGYQVRLDQGNKALQNSASAAGGLYSGRAAKDLTTYTQGQASQEYGNAYGRLANLASLGQASANQQAQNGNTLVSNVTGNNAAIGNAQAAGTVGSTNDVTGALSQILNQNSQSTLLQQLLKNGGAANGYYATNGSV